jgi:hypothetical protein
MTKSLLEEPTGMTLGEILQLVTFTAFGSVGVLAVVQGLIAWLEKQITTEHRASH